MRYGTTVFRGYHANRTGRIPAALGRSRFMGSGIRFLIPVFLALFLASCSETGQDAGFTFSGPDGLRIPVFINGGTVPDIDRLKLSGPVNGEYSLPRFVFEQPVSIPAGHSFRIDFTILEGNENPSIVLYSDDSRIMRTAALPGKKNTEVSFIMNPGKGKKISGFTIAGKNPTVLKILGTGTGKSGSGFKLTKGKLVLSDSFRLNSPGTARPGKFSVTWSSPLQDSGFSSDIAVRVQAAGGTGGGNATFTFRESVSGKRKSFDVFINPETTMFSFPTGLTGFPADSMEFFSETQIETVAAEYLPVFGTMKQGAYDPDIVPIPADQGSILLYDSSAWRRKEFELFSWNVFPGVLIFDFSDYEVQARFFARLGFFIAVTGEAGKIEEESYYKGKHSYNAHDYKPEDLASFFTLAERSGRELNAEEYFLKELCIRRGIIEESDGTLSPGSGAVLSVSRETTPSWLRKRLLTHESDHGLFYAVGAYRDACFAIWNGLEDHQREFFLIFLGNKGKLDGREGYDGYDPENEYLIINEMQAHVLQLESRQVEDYFAGTYLQLMKRRFPEKISVLRKVEADDGFFTNLRRALEEAVFETTDIRGADFYSIRSARER